MSHRASRDSDPSSHEHPDYNPSDNDHPDGNHSDDTPSASALSDSEQNDRIDIKPTDNGPSDHSASGSNVSDHAASYPKMENSHEYQPKCPPDEGNTCENEGHGRRNDCQQSVNDRSKAPAHGRTPALRSSRAHAFPYPMERSHLMHSSPSGYVQMLNNYYQQGDRTPNLLQYREVMRWPHSDIYIISLILGDRQSSNYEFRGQGLGKHAAKEHAARQALYSLELIPRYA